MLGRLWHVANRSVQLRCFVTLKCTEGRGEASGTLHAKVLSRLAYNHFMIVFKAMDPGKGTRKKFLQGYFFVAGLPLAFPKKRPFCLPDRFAGIFAMMPLLDGQRNWFAAGGSRLAELSRVAAGGAADELCRSRTAAAGRAA